MEPVGISGDFLVVASPGQLYPPRVRAGGGISAGAGGGGAGGQILLGHGVDGGYVHGTVPAPAPL